jgi:hypothetical protein
MTFYRQLVLIVVVAGLVPSGYFFTNYPSARAEYAIDTVRSYLKATYARDFKNAYRCLSPADQNVRDEQSFVDSQGSYNGFTLEVGRTLANFMEIWPIEQSRTNEGWRIKIGYRVPAPADLAGLLLNWNEARLNALSQNRQQQILAEIATRSKDNNLLMIEGQESFELRKEGKTWKISLDWASAMKVKLQTQLPQSGELNVRFAQSEVMSADDELFLVNLVIENRAARAITFTVTHHVNPQLIGENLELVECGLRAPVTLQAGSSQEFSMAYLLATAARQNHRELALTYEFKLQ